MAAEVGDEDGIHEKEYALALQRIVLGSADDIFTACKEQDQEGHGILSTDVFCYTVSSVLGVPYEDAVLLVDPKASASGQVPYASWLMKLQQNMALRSPQRQRYKDVPANNYNNTTDPFHKEFREDL